MSLPHSYQSGECLNYGQPKVLGRHGARAALVHRWWECEMVQRFWKSVEHLWKNLDGLRLTARLPGLHSNPLKTSSQAKTYTRIFIAALFLSSQAWTMSLCE